MTLTLSDVGPQEHAQVFWSLTTQGDFQEADSLRFPIRDGQRSYEVSIPATAARLRLDPRESPGPFSVRDFRMRNFLFLTVLSPENESAVAPYQNVRMTEKNQVFASVGKDPILNLTFWTREARRGLIMANGLLALAIGAGLWMVFFWLKKKGPLISNSLNSSKPIPGRRIGPLMAIVPILALLFGALISEGAFRLLENLKYQRALKNSLEFWELLANDLRAYQWPAEWRSSERKLALKGGGYFAFRLNSEGFRGADWQLEKSPRHRILILGDSYTFGWGVSDNETYPAQLQARLNRAGRAFQVINAGVPGYGTIQQYAVLNDLIGRVSPKVVVVGVVLNDAHPPGGLPTAPRITFQFAWSWLGSELAERLYPRLPSWIPRTKFVPRAHYNEDFSHPINARAFRTAHENISRLSEHHKAKLLVLILPDFTQEFDSSYHYRQAHEGIQKMIGSLRIQTRDLLSHFEDRQRQGPGIGKGRRTRAQELRIPIDGHPNPAGQEQIAEQLLRFLEETDSLE